MDQNTFPDYQDFDYERAKLERRRRIAEQLVASPLAPTTVQVGDYHMPNFAGAFNRFMQQTSGNREMADIEEKEKLLSANQARNTAQVMQGLATRGTKQQLRQGEGPLLTPNIDTVDLSPQEESQRRLKIMGQGLGNPSIRNLLTQQMGQEFDVPYRIAEAEAKRKFDAEQAELKRIEDGEQKAADRVSKLELRSTPTVHISTGGGSGQGKAPSGYRWTDDGNLMPIAGGPADKSNAVKPLTAKQLETQRGFMDLDKSIANYEQLLNGYDFQGKTAVDPATRAALEGAYTDLQMKLKTLYELGAPQAGDLKLLSQAIPNPVDMSGTVRGAAFGSAPFKAKLNETKKLLANSKANFEAQFGKETPVAPTANPDIQPVRISSREEWQKLPAGTPYVTADGKRGVR